MHKEGKRYKKAAKALNAPRDTVGKIVHKLKDKRTVASLPECGVKRMLSWAATRFLSRQVVKKSTTECKRAIAGLGCCRH